MNLFASTSTTNAAQTLLIPLDGSPAAEAVLPAATTLARALPARLSLLHSIERDAPEQVHGERHLTGVAEAETYLAAVAARLEAEGLTVDWHVHVVPVGDIALSIAAHANEHGAFLILLSTHAVNDPRSWLAGAVAQGVIRYAAPPVLLQRTGPRGEAMPFTPAEVTVAIDPGREGQAALPAALRLARALAIPVRLLTVVPTVETLPGDQAAAARLLPSGAAAALDLEAQEMATELRRLVARVAAAVPDVPVVAEVARGDPSQVIAATSRERRGILALATHGRAGLVALWAASIGAQVIARAPGPFLLTHPEPATPLFET